jgi:putative DNA primase/helicase
MPRRRRQQATAVAAPAPNSCRFCQSATTEPQRNPTPITDSNGRVLVCPACRTKARKRELANTYRPKRMIRIDGTPADPRIALGLHVEAQYTFDAIRAALESESDPWHFLVILNDRLVLGENTEDRRRDSQQFRELYIQKLIAMPSDGELHVLVGRGQIAFGYASGAVERQVRQARPVEQASTDVVDPWPEHVDGVEVVDDVVAKLREFLIMADQEVDATALWTAFTHCFTLFDFAPYLLLKSAEKRCAKSRVMDVVAPMSGSSLVATHMRAETLFRALEKHHFVAFLDEAHSYIRKGEDFEAVVNGGFQRGKPVWRCVGDDHDPRPFDIFAPKCLAFIGDLNDTIEDRGVIQHMQRKTRDQHVRPWVRGELIEREELRPIRRRLNRWALDHAEELRAANPEIPHALYVNDRAVDIWRPLFAIADVVGGDWPQRARHAAVMLTNRALAEAPETDGTELLRNIRTIFYPTRADGTALDPHEVLSVSELCLRLTNRAEWQWASVHNGKPLTAYRLKTMLKKYHVTSVQKRKSPGTRQSPKVWGFWRDDLDGVFEKYLATALDGASLDDQGTEQDESATPAGRPAGVACLGSPNGTSTEAPEAPGDGASQAPETPDISEAVGASVATEARPLLEEVGSRGTESPNGRRPVWTDVDPEVFAERARQRRAS